MLRSLFTISTAFLRIVSNLRITLMAKMSIVPTLRARNTLP